MVALVLELSDSSDGALLCSHVGLTENDLKWGRELKLLLRRVLLVVLILLIGFATATPVLAISDDGLPPASDAELILAGVAGAMASVLPTTRLALTSKWTIFPVLKVFLSALAGWFVYFAFLPYACNESVGVGQGCWGPFGNEVEDSATAGLPPAAIMAGATWIILTFVATWRQSRRRRHLEPGVDLRRPSDVKPLTGLLVIVTLLVAACGVEPPAPQADRSASPTPPASPLPKDQLYEGTGVVLDKAKGKGSIFCLGSIQESAPPQCEGAELRGWSWAELDFDESAGIRWGTFTLRGTYIDGVFTVKGEPEEPEPYVDNGDDDINAPCPHADGWEIPDPERTSEGDRLAATRAAEAQPDFAGAWIDYIAEPTNQEEMQPWGENIVLVLAFTEDAERHETEAREHWGGALCIWIHDRTEAELASIQDDLGEPWIAEMGIERTFSDRDITTGTVMIGVIVSTPEFEAELARRYGEGVVEVQPALHPID